MRCTFSIKRIPARVSAHRWPVKHSPHLGGGLRRSGGGKSLGTLGSRLLTRKAQDFVRRHDPAAFLFDIKGALQRDSIALPEADCFPAYPERIGGFLPSAVMRDETFGKAGLSFHAPL